MMPGRLVLRAGDLDRVLDGFGAAVQEKRFLWKLTRSDFVHALGEANVALIGSDLDAGMQKFVELPADSSTTAS